MNGNSLFGGTPYTLSVGVLVACVVAFGGLASAVMGASGLIGIDAIAHDALHAIVGSREGLFEGITFFGNNATIVALVVIVSLALILAKRLGLAFRVLFASGLGGLVVVSLKQLFQRTRPLDQILTAHGYSFPSGHAFAATVFYGMMVVLVWRLTDRPWARTLAMVLGLVVIIAVGLSRVYLNVHYPTDVLAGWAAGLAWLMACVLLLDAVERRRRTQP